MEQRTGGRRRRIVTEGAHRDQNVNDEQGKQAFRPLTDLPILTSELRHRIAATQQDIEGLHAGIDHPGLSGAVGAGTNRGADGGADGEAEWTHRLYSRQSAEIEGPIQDQLDYFRGQEPAGAVARRFEEYARLVARLREVTWEILGLSARLTTRPETDPAKVADGNGEHAENDVIDEHDDMDVDMDVNMARMVHGAGAQSARQR
jgi:hypothetical protein